MSNIMKVTLFAVTTALAAGVGSAYAGDGGGQAPNTWFTELPGVLAQAPVHDDHGYTTNWNGAGYVTQQQRASVPSQRLSRG
jgi:hypothetical protein